MHIAQVFGLESRSLSEEIRDIDAMLYVMADGNRPGTPSEHYLNVCRKGYQDFGFNEKILKKALRDSRMK